jgi:methionyl-tRNA synthetase
LNESGTRLYSDLEVDTLIDEISEAALEAIEQAAGEAAKAAVLSVIEREAVAIREAQHWKMEAETAKKAGKKNAVLTGVISFLSGLLIGTGIIIFSGVHK